MGTVIDFAEYKQDYVKEDVRDVSRNIPRHVKIDDIESYRDVTLWLMDQDLQPKVSNIGCDVKRFYVHAGNQNSYWADGATMFEACEDAVNAWIEDKYPVLN